MLQKYITCEGHFSLTFLYHIMILLHFKGQRINLPYFLWKSLTNMAAMTQRKFYTRTMEQNLDHHGLVKLLVLDELRKKNDNKEDFIARN
jgi:hypothetical protein